MKKWSLLLIVFLSMLLIFTQQQRSSHFPQLVTAPALKYEQSKVPQSINTVSVSAECKPFSKEDKYLIDDWLFALQNLQEVEQWADHLSLLPECLHQIAGRYVEFKQALGQVDEQLNLSERLEQLHALQRRFFTKEVIVLWFEEDNAWDRQTVNRWQILSDTRLSEAQKQQLIEANISQLSKSEQSLFRATAQLHDLHANLKQRSYNELSADFGDDVAMRVLEVTQQDLDWQQKLHTFQAQKQTILAEYGNTPAATEQIEALLIKSFTENERKRVAVLTK